MQKVGWNEFGKSCSKMYQNSSLRSKRFQSSYCANVRASFMFFLLLSQLSRRTSRGNACYAGYTRTCQKVSQQLVENPRPRLIEKNNEFTFCFAVKFLKIKKTSRQFCCQVLKRGSWLEMKYLRQSVIIRDGFPLFAYNLCFFSRARKVILMNVKQ